MLMNELSSDTTYVYEHIDGRGNTVYIGCGAGSRCLSVTTGRAEPHRKFMIESAEDVGDAFVNILYESDDHADAREREADYLRGHYELHGRYPTFNARGGGAGRPKGTTGIGSRRITKAEKEVMKHLRYTKDMTYKEIGAFLRRQPMIVWENLNPARQWKHA